MSEPSVTRAFNSSVLPKLAEIGFIRLGGKRYARLRNDVCQFLFLHVESRIKREFMLEYSTILICQPHDVQVLDPGGKFPYGKNGRWYPAHREARLAESVGLVAEQVPKTLIPWYERSITIPGFIDTYSGYLEENPHLARNGHSEFTVACAHARTSDAHSAAAHAEKAIIDYERIYDQRPACEWAKDGAGRCRRLLDSLAQSTTDTLFAQWRSHTIESLKLAALIGPAKKG